MKLTDSKIRALKPREKPYKVSDGRGLYVEVMPNGSRYWRYKYRFGGKEKRLALGVYPSVTLKEAREQHSDARQLLTENIDPSLHKKATKRRSLESTANTFEAVALEWFERFKHKWAESYHSKILLRLNNDIFPYIGKRPISEITSPELLTVLRKVESRGAIDTAHRERNLCGQIFRYAISTGRADRDPSADLKGAIPPAKSKRYSTITDSKQIGHLLNAINSYEGYFPIKCALQLAPRFFVRPGELRNAEWDEFDLLNCEWRIPGEKMKMGESHIVPLSSQSIEIIQELERYSGNGKYLFPSVRGPRKPISENSLNAALRSLGFTKEQIVVHGFRSMASTRLNEMGFNPDWIETQLAHKDPNAIRGAYNQAKYLEQRRDMMQQWTNYLEGLKNEQ